MKEKLATKAEEERKWRKEGTTEECWVQIDEEQEGAEASETGGVGKKRRGGDSPA